MEPSSLVGYAAPTTSADNNDTLPAFSAPSTSAASRKASSGAASDCSDRNLVAPHVPSCWPFISSHYREWLFSAEQLRDRRASVHAKALKRLEEADPTLAATLPGPDEMLQLQRYFALQLLLIFQKKGLRAYALETACLFFHRFFLSVSPLEVDVRLVLFSCLLLALKAIDVARHYTLGELLGDIEDLDLEAVVALELPVCEGLQFQLLTLHTREPLNELVAAIVDHIETQYQQQQQQARDKIADTQNQQQQQNSTDGSGSSNSLSSVLDVLETKRISLLAHLVRLQEDAEASCLLMHVSPSLPLRYPPCQLALAGLLASPVRRELQQQGIDVEAILKQHILSVTGDKLAASAAAPLAIKEAGTRWSCIQKCVEGIVEEVRAVRNLQKQTQGGAFSQKMADLLGKAIDATEALEAAKGDGESRREKKKKKKQKKVKKEN